MPGTGACRPGSHLAATGATTGVRRQQQWLSRCSISYLASTELLVVCDNYYRLQREVGVHGRWLVLAGLHLHSTCEAGSAPPAAAAAAPRSWWLLQAASAHQCSCIPS